MRVIKLDADELCFGMFLVFGMSLVWEYRGVGPAVFVIGNSTIDLTHSTWKLLLALHHLIKYLPLLQLFNIRFEITRSQVLLRRRPTREVLERYAHEMSEFFIGLNRIKIPNIAGVLHPVDRFVEGLYLLYNKAAQSEAVSKFKRTNPTLGLRLEQVRKFCRNFKVTGENLQRLNQVSEEIADEFIRSERFASFAKEVKLSCEGQFKSLVIEGSSAAGYPYLAGVKRRDVIHEVLDLSSQMLTDDIEFDSYMRDHVWYTTGRAKMQEIDKEPAARLICYGGFCSMLLSMLYFQPWQKFMNMCEWCAVGMSWMHEGAAKFAAYFDDVGGVCEDHHEYCVFDMKGWDATLCPDLLRAAKNVHIRIMHAAGIDDNYVRRFDVIFEDMINAKLLFPFGYTFQSNAGMKSGWSNTANDNTLIHELIFRCIEKEFGPMKHKLYGDDNFFKKPSNIPVESIVSMYGQFGVEVGHCVSSRYLKDVDFLSKNVIYEDGEYYVYRPEIETHSRLIMPEEMDPSRRIVPDCRIAAERLIGHLFDNPFNQNVKTTVYQMLHHLKEHYGMTHIVIDDELLKRAPWKFMDTSRLRGEIPIIPDYDMICELYGVKKRPLVLKWPGLDFTSQIKFGFGNERCDVGRFMSTRGYFMDVMNNFLTLSRNKRKTVAKYTSPYVNPKYVKGFHGARFEFAIEYFGIAFEKMLDFGSHPGAAAFSALKRCQDVTCVTLVPECDKHAMPYVIRRKGLKIINQDVNSYDFIESFDLLHDDVDLVGKRTFETDSELAVEALRRFRRASKRVKQCLMTVHDITPNVLEEIYNTYKVYGHFDIVKPLYSNPWKPEFMLYFKKTNTQPVRKNVFNWSLFKYFNEHSSDMVRWIELLNANVDLASGGFDVQRCPLQADEAFQSGCQARLFGD